MKYTLRSMPRGKTHGKPIANTCNVPYYTVTIDSESNCMVCGCEGWLPIPVGKVSDFDSIESVLHSPAAKMLQQDIDQKKFTWCAVSYCGVLKQSHTRNTYNLNINIDNSCNLACPSCRRDITMINSGPEYEKKVKDVDSILTWLEKFEHPIVISLGGTGDALASLICRNLIRNYKYRDNQKFIIGTNGLLLKKVMAGAPLSPAVSHYSVSVDAGTKVVYENVRRPGKWEVLLSNLEWLSKNRQNASVQLNFVLQNENYQDLLDFVELCQRYEFVGGITTINDWGTWNSQPVSVPDEYTVANGTYLDHNVADPSHKNHKHFVETLNLVRQQNHKFILFNSFFDQFQ